MTTGSKTSVQDSLIKRGIALSEDEVKKVEINYLRLKAIYEGICDWTPPQEDGSQA